MIEVCALDGCVETFEKKVHNQRFCSRECCRVYTNARILEQYHEKKNRDMSNRTCNNKGCKTVLSIYNDDKFCGIHQREKHLKKLKSWGWKIDEANYA